MTVKVQNTDMNSERQKALENAMHQITREFGAGAIMRLGDMKGKLDTEVIPTGSLALDIAVGVGGYPRGRVIEIYGPESSGKTTLALHAIAEAQKNNGVAAFIDAEHALDPVYAHHLGVDTERLLISQPDSGEQAFSICELLVRGGAVELILELLGAHLVFLRAFQIVPEAVLVGLQLEALELLAGLLDLQCLEEVFKRFVHCEQLLLVGIVFDHSHGVLSPFRCSFISRKSISHTPDKGKKKSALRDKKSRGNGLFALFRP